MKKAPLALTIISALLISLVVGVQVVEVVKANWTLPPSPPAVVVEAPRDAGTSSESLNLVFSVSHVEYFYSYIELEWFAYSIDDKPTVSFEPTMLSSESADTKRSQYTTTIRGLSSGSHTIVVQVAIKNVFGSVAGKSNIVHFRVDTYPPNIDIQSPRNQTYNRMNVTMCIGINEPTSRIAYSLDQQANITIDDMLLVGNYRNTNLTLSEGLHSIVVYAEDIVGNLGKSSTIFFTLDVTPPSMANSSIENKTYASTELSLSLVFNETTSWICYSLDNEANVTLTENTTLYGLLAGYHTLVIFANDTAGNMGKSDTVEFTIQPNLQAPTSPSPTLQLTIPQLVSPTEVIIIDYGTNPMPYVLGTVAAVIIAFVAGVLYTFRHKKPKTK